LEVKITLRNPLDKQDTLDYYIIPNDNQLSRDWISSLKEVLSDNLRLQKEFCFLGFPNSPRTLERLCDELNQAIKIINTYKFNMHPGIPEYVIEDWFHPNSVRFDDSYHVESTVMSDNVSGRTVAIGLQPKHEILNRLHNHFERLQGTVEAPSQYATVAPKKVTDAIGKLNHICHEMESLILSQRKALVAPEWMRPSQIMTFENRKRYSLTDEHRQGFLDNGYDRRFAHVYMHWTQIGKTLIEVFRDEGAPELDDATCEAITHLQYYSGEFDVEWGRSVVRGSGFPWHERELLKFEDWLLKHGYDPRDPSLSLGYLELGKVDLDRSFGTSDMFKVWNQLETHLDIYSIEVDGVRQTFNYCWSDEDEMD
jgi:hypothetical protein